LQPACVATAGGQDDSHVRHVNLAVEINVASQVPRILRGDWISAHERANRADVRVIDPAIPSRIALEHRDHDLAVLQDIAGHVRDADEPDAVFRKIWQRRVKQNLAAQAVAPEKSVRVDT
jgi:hypothetical protein